MTLKVFAIYDTQVEAYANPFFLHTVGEAKRAFAELAVDRNTKVGKYPADFALFELGEYDDLRGQFANLNAPLNHGLAIEFIKPASENKQ